MELIEQRVQAGVWRGLLQAKGTIRPVRVAHQGQDLPDVSIAPVPEQGPDLWQVHVPIPAALLSDGVQSFLVLGDGDTVLARFTLIVGVPAEQDLIAEVALLRAELDLLKRAFRAHCAATTTAG